MESFLERLSPIWQPHAGQLEFLTNQARIKVLACGRRWGKTDACAVAILASLFQPFPKKHLILAPTLDQATLLFDRGIELLKSLLEQECKETKVKHKSSPYPKFEWNGHRVIARSGHLGRSLRGNEATDIVVDEAAFVPEELLAEVAMPMLATTGGTLTLISTPRGMNHFWRFFQMGQEQREGESPEPSPPPPSPFSPGEKGEGARQALSIWSRRAPTSESPYVAPGFLEMQKRLISERAFRVEYEAEFLDSAGRVFRTEAIDACLVSAFEKEHEPPYYIGVDWAKFGDYTAVAVLSGIRQQAQLVEIDRFHGSSWKEQVEKAARLIKRFPRAQVLCDATGQGDPLVEMLREHMPGTHVEGLHFTAPLKAEMIDRLAWMFENEALQMLPHPDLIRELQHFEITETASGTKKFGAIEGSHDDLVISLALACRLLPHRYGASFQVGAKREFSRERKTIDWDLFRL